tara:strand:+ start:81437 stop:81643 length:207 start_codon:yes stop_codon:yes gene_type:complete
LITTASATITNAWWAPIRIWPATCPWMRTATTCRIPWKGMPEPIVPQRLKPACKPIPRTGWWILVPIP